MDFRHFRTFVIAAEELHFGRTAERLDIAQPAVTQQIKTLETQVGFKVFQRVGRGIALTQAGAVFLEHARATLARADIAVQAGRRASRGELGSLCIAYIHSAMLEPELPALLRRFSELRPDVRLELRNISVQEQVDALSDERIDVAFLRSPPGALPSMLRVATFSRTPLDIVLPAGHPHARRRRIALRDVSAERFIVVDDPPGVGLGHRVRQLCEQAGFQPRAELRASDSLGVVSLAAAGLGVGLAPRTLARFGTDGAVFKPVPMAACFSEILMATRAYDASAVVREFVRLATRSKA